jgi:hypothetical protein
MPPPSALQKRREKRTIFHPQTFTVVVAAAAAANSSENDNNNNNNNTSNEDDGIVDEYKNDIEPLLSPSSSPSLSISPSLSCCGCFPFEASLHNLPRTLYNEIELVFPDIASQVKYDKQRNDKMRIMNDDNNNNNNNNKREYFVIPTYHIAKHSILELNDKTENERLRIFLRFKNYFVTDFYNLLKQKDQYALLDIPDIDGSASTLFSNSNGDSDGCGGGGGNYSSTIYDEVASTRSILGYSTFLYCGLQIVSHPNYGYEKLAIHTIIIYSRLIDVKETYMELFKRYNKINEESSRIEISKSNQNARTQDWT